VRIVATDLNQPMLDRAAAVGTARPVEWRQADVQALPFADGSFDATLSQLVVNFMADAEAGVRELARVTRHGGIVASCVWDYTSGMTLLRAFWDAVREVDPERAAAADEATMRWCRDGELAELWRAAGVADVRSGALVASAAYDDFEDLWSGFMAGIGPAGAFCKALDDSGRGAVREAFRRRLGVNDGPFELTARAWAAAGRAA
jgi:ubiquinone/menaquinone biosynthesis C-methylase UbiE